MYNFNNQIIKRMSIKKNCYVKITKKHKTLKK